MNTDKERNTDGKKEIQKERKKKYVQASEQTKSKADEQTY
jgi:hypothetical protein